MPNPKLPATNTLHGIVGGCDTYTGKHMHLRELVELLGKPTGWTDQQTLSGLDPYVILEWTRDSEAVLCIMTQATETAIALERAGPGYSYRWIVDSAQELLSSQLEPATSADTAWTVLAPWLD